MLRFFNLDSKNFWILSLILFSLILSSALFFQIVLGMEPCYLCIIQRVGVIIGIIFSIIGLLFNKYLIFRIISILGVLSGIMTSLIAAIKLVKLQLNPPLFSSCGMSATELMDNYGFLKSLPILFKGSASCSNSAGQFMFFTFEQWTLTLFILILLSFGAITIYNIFKK